MTRLSLCRSKKGYRATIRRRRGALLKVRGSLAGTLLLLILVFVPMIDVRLPAWSAADSVPVRDFNRMTRLAHDKGASWTLSPLLVSLKLAGETCECSTRRIELKSTPEAFKDAAVKITDQGYLDDSIRGYQYSLVLRRVAAGYWEVVEATKARNCWKGRGHEDFSNAPCS